MQTMRCFIIFILTVSIARGQDMTNVKLKTSTAMNGNTFDNMIANTSCMVLFWSSNDSPSRLFKRTQWDMLASEKHKHLNSKDDVLVGEIDCGDTRNVPFCRAFVAFDVTKLTYPYIGLSYFNESFRKYNGSMEYPNLVDFFRTYFNRDCHSNRTYCTEEELGLLDEWSKLTIVEKIKIHRSLLIATDQLVANFTRWSTEVKENVARVQEDVQENVNEADRRAKLLRSVIMGHPLETVLQALEEIDNITNITDVIRKEVQSESIRS